MSGCKSKMDSYADINGPGKSQREFSESVMTFLSLILISEYLGLKADANLLPSDFNIASGHHNPPPIDDQLLLDAYHQQK